MPETDFGNRYKRSEINFNFPNFVTKLGPTAALFITQLGRELHKYFSGSPEETHNELESRFMVGTLWSPKGPEGFWLGPSGPSCFQTPASCAEKAALCFAEKTLSRKSVPAAPLSFRWHPSFPNRESNLFKIKAHIWPVGCSINNSVGARASQTFLGFA
jgi:hypothetical protein